MEQLICTTSPERNEATFLPAVVGASRITTAHSGPLQLEWTVKGTGLAVVVGAIVVVTGALAAVIVELSLAVVDALDLDRVPSSRPTSATPAAAAATTRRTTTAASITMRFRDLRAAGLRRAGSVVVVVVVTAADSARGRSSGSLREVRERELSTPNAAFSKDAIQSLSSVRESRPVSDSLPTQWRAYAAIQILAAQRYSTSGPARKRWRVSNRYDAHDSTIS